MEKHDIECLFYAGGNDSMDTVKMLSDYAAAHNKPQRFMGVPKTIDNDLPVTDHCPGYGSAAKYIATSVKEIIRDNESRIHCHFSANLTYISAVCNLDTFRYRDHYGRLVSCQLFNVCNKPVDIEYYRA